MSLLQDLYKDVIVDHQRQPRNRGHLDAATHQAEGHNPLCGDQLHLMLKIQDQTIEDIAFEGQGCAISTASASLLTEHLKGKTVQDATRLFNKMHDLLTDSTNASDAFDELGKLAALQGVRAFPMRVKCATLAWHTLNAALNNNQVASTE